MSDFVHFVITGGTIDSHYDVTKDTVVPLKKSAVPDYMGSLKLYDKIEFSQICMKDSRDLNSKDTKEILKCIESSKAKRIIITHGTYTMADTAKYLKHNLKIKDKTIVFTASMIPLVGFTPTDASFNLGYAFSQVKILEPGIYVCMNGRTFLADNVRKILSEGRFASIYTK